MYLVNVVDLLLPSLVPFLLAFSKIKTKNMNFLGSLPVQAANYVKLLWPVSLVVEFLCVRLLLTSSLLFGRSGIYFDEHKSWQTTCWWLFHWCITWKFSSDMFYYLSLDVNSSAVNFGKPRSMIQSPKMFFGSSSISFSS